VTTPAPTPTPAPATGPDRPPIPPVGMSRLVKIYVGLASAALLVYLLAGMLGWDFRGSERDRVPGSVRNSPGGYRAYHFWHSGYHGGK